MLRFYTIRYEKSMLLNALLLNFSKLDNLTGEVFTRPAHSIARSFMHMV